MWPTLQLPDYINTLHWNQFSTLSPAIGNWRFWPGHRQCHQREAMKWQKHVTWQALLDTIRFHCFSLVTSVTLLSKLQWPMSNWLLMTGLSSRPKTEKSKKWRRFRWSGSVAIRIWSIFDPRLKFLLLLSINFHFRPCRRFLAELQGMAMAFYGCDNTKGSHFSAASSGH